MAANRIWDNFQPIGEVQKTAKQKYVFALAAREGVRYLNIREFYFKGTTQEWKASWNGIAIPLMIPINNGTEVLKVLEHFIPMLQHTAELLPAFELYNEANVVERPPGRAPKAIPARPKLMVVATEKGLLEND